MAFVKGSLGEEGKVKEYTDGLEGRIDSAFKDVGGDLIDIFYPIGTIYESTNPKNPSLFMGGQWESYGNGRVTVGLDTTQTEFNSVGKTGGAKTHKLLLNEIPPHQHSINVSGTGSKTNIFTGWSWADSKPATAFMSNEGGGEAHNNLQPYIVVYRFRRIA